MSSRRAAGLSPRGARLFEYSGAAIVAFFAIAWTWSIGNAVSAARRGEAVASPGSIVAAALSGASGTATAYLTDAALRALASSARGISGRLRAQVALPGDTLHADSLPGGAHVVYTAPGAQPVQRPSNPGIRQVAVAVGQALKPIANLNLITLHPFSEKREGRIGDYLIGTFPAEQGARGPARAPAGRYANPRGFIEVTPQNMNTRVSEHFRLRDFLTKGQSDVWPKYLVLELRLVDKLELVIADMKSRGIPADDVVVFSGFRTPTYNVSGGNTAGRADLSRHMFGDASDLYIDADRNGIMDDLNGDGRSDMHDARVIRDAVDRVERAHPQLIGGAGLYRACCGHGPFIHIDTRGYRARW